MGLQKLKVYSVHIPQGRTLHISVSSEETNLNMSNNSEAGPLLSLEDKNGTQLELDNSFFSIRSRQDTSACSASPVSETIKVKMTTHPFQKSETYAGKITFSAKIR